jgi:hypothetical protein
LLTEEADLAGDMVAVAVVDEESVTDEKGGDKLCQPTPLFAPMELA